MGSLDQVRRRVTARLGFRRSGRSRRRRREKLGRALVIAMLGATAFLLGLLWDRPSASGRALAPPSADAEAQRRTLRHCGESVPVARTAHT